MNRRGWTLHEAIVSLTVMGGVLGLVAHQSTNQLRLYREIGDAVAARERVMQATAIAEQLLWNLSAESGDVLVAQDSALEIRVQIGAALVCEATPARVVIPAPSASRGNALAAFSDAPEPGDGVAVLFHDSLGTTWLTARVATAATATTCARFSRSGWELALVEPIALPAGAALRFTRSWRLSLYRAGDSKWYLGAKDWNHELQRYNTIQPVAGPLAPYDRAGVTSGLIFRYRDRGGATLDPPVDTRRIASITLETRSLAPASGGVPPRPSDSSFVTIALRNAR